MGQSGERFGCESGVRGQVQAVNSQRKLSFRPPPRRPAVSHAQAATAWPTKPITLVVTYPPPAGGADTMARLIAPKLSEAFRPIGLIALFPNVLLVNAQFSVKSVADLVVMAKVRKDAVTFASSGNGSAQHLAGALFESAAKVEMAHIPYKGAGPAINDVVGAEIYEWNVILAPAGTPEAVVQKLSAALQKALESPEVLVRIAQLGGELQKGSPDVAQSFIR